MVEFEDGKIKTELSDMGFIELVWRRWAGYNEAEIEALWAATDTLELSDDCLKTEGFDVTMNLYFIQGDTIRLIKRGTKEWILDDASPEEMEVFVDELMTEE